jgi:hypothetical protein
MGKMRQPAFRILLLSGDPGVEMPKGRRDEPLMLRVVAPIIRSIFRSAKGNNLYNLLHSLKGDQVPTALSLIRFNENRRQAFSVGKYVHLPGFLW